MKIICLSIFMVLLFAKNYADCGYGEWQGWSECTKSCGEGYSERWKYPDDWDCDDLKERVSCNEGPCPVHCSVSQWSSWGSCSTTCGSGQKSRNRVIETEPENSGDACPALEEEDSCTLDPCPVVVECLRSGKTWRKVILHFGDKAIFTTAGVYKPWMKCHGKFELADDCSAGIVNCPRFNLISSSGCRFGDFLAITDSKNTYKRFCKSTGPKNFKPVGDFKIRLITNGAKSGAGVECDITCPVAA